MYRMIRLDDEELVALVKALEWTVEEMGVVLEDNHLMEEKDVKELTNLMTDTNAIQYEIEAQMEKFQ